MAKKTELMPTDKNIVTESLEDEMSKSYIDYAMSVIIERALPDVRDGLKPVQRRVLYDMHMLHIGHDQPYRKSARIVGDTMGKYHPHGDSSIYGALTHMSQDWVFPLPLIDKHGNMGSIEGDGAAAMRYCVVGDTLVNTQKGLMYIDRIVPKTKRNSDNRCNIRVKSVQGKINSCHTLFNSSYQEVIQVNLTNGMSLKATGNHPILVYAGNRKYKWCLVENLKPGMEAIIDNNPDNAMYGRNNTLSEAVDMAGKFRRNDENYYIPWCVLKGTKMYLITYVNNLFNGKDVLITKSERFASALQIMMYTQLGMSTKKSYNQKTKEFILTKTKKMVRYERVKIKSCYKLKDKQIVYSLKVDSTCHSFTGNGFINHNTEARLSELTEKNMLDGLGSDMVDYVPNFDETEKEPVLLPSKYPNLLVSGTEGIAVGMASSIPTHNLGEVIDAAKLYLSKKNITLDELLSVMKGPDFATGGIIANKSAIMDIYRTGNGKLRVRGKAEKGEENGCPRIIITEIPPTMIGRIDKFMQSVADLMRDKKAPDIVNISNLSSKEGIKIVVELRKGSSYEKNLNILYKKAKLEDTFSVNMLAVENGQPKVYPLMDYLESFTRFQIEINTRKYRNLLEKRKRDREIKEGLIRAVDVIDIIIAILKGSKNKKQATDCLINGKTEGISFKTKVLEKAASKLMFTELQANEILSMQLSRLIGLEIDALKKELDSCNKDIEEYNGYLESTTKMKNRIKSDLDTIKKEFAIPRKTQILDEAEVVLGKEEIQEYFYYLVCDKFRYVKLLDEPTYQRNVDNIPSDYRYCVRISNLDKLLIFTDTGKMHSLKAMQVPLCRYKLKGTPLENLSNLESNENVLFLCPLSQITGDNGKNILFFTRKGLVKSVPGEEFNITTKTTNAAKMGEGDLMSHICLMDDKEAVIGTRNGMWIRFSVNEISVQKRNSAGVRSIQLKGGDEVEKVFTGDSSSEFNHNGMQYPFSKIRLSKRGGSGTKTKFPQEQVS